MISWGTYRLAVYQRNEDDFNRAPSGRVVFDRPCGAPYLPLGPTYAYAWTPRGTGILEPYARLKRLHGR